MCLTFAACSDNGSDSGNTGSDNSSSTSESSSTPESSASESTDSTTESAPGNTEPDNAPVRVVALKGPTAMGMTKLMSDSEGSNEYDFEIVAAVDEISPMVAQGTADIVCVPANLGSVLYNKTEGGVRALAVNTLGVLYICENGDTVTSVEDLKGKTIFASGKGATPEYALNFILKSNDIDPENDVTIEWKSEHAECVAALAAGTADIALLPQPFVTVAQGKLENLRVALDLTAEWDALDNGSAMITGVAVARRALAEENPKLVGAFLEDYAASVDWVNANPQEA